eukprot:maker-scaffold71_size417697-snap-gene-0.16 protein:Tk11800 transcript:maker-scaffold71_size417697-snap-gene-0.16-mRNA-1 annotation:"hypothetical protein THAOC_09262"
MSESVSNLLEVGGAQEMVQVLDSVQSISHLETELISKGFHLLQLLEMADDVLGPFITVECVISLMSQVFGAFFSTNLMMALHGEGTFEPVKFTFGVACTFGALQWFFRLLLIFESGQRIVEEMVQTKKHLELIHINGCDVRDNFAQQRAALVTAPTDEDSQEYQSIVGRCDKALATIVLAVKPSLLDLLGDPEDPAR